MTHEKEDEQEVMMGRAWKTKRGGIGEGEKVGLVAFPFHDDPLMNLTTIKTRTLVHEPSASK